MADLLLKNAEILTMDRENTAWHPGYLLIAGDRIQEIGPMESINALGSLEGIQTLDCSGKIVLPGMVNTHSHLSMIVFRSLADDLPDRLRRYMMPLERSAMDREMAVAGARYAFAELILGGVTTVHDAYYFEDEIAEAAKACKIRGVFAQTVLSAPSPDTLVPYGGIPLTEALLEKWAGDELIRPAVNCHAVYTNDAAHLIRCHALAREYGVLMSMHVAEMAHEWNDCLREYGKTPVGYLDSLGILDDRFLAAHSILVTDADLDLYQKRGVKVSYNPGANAKSAKGVMPLPKMCARKIPVGLGSDGPMSGNTIDLLTQLPLVGKIQKLFHHDRALFPAKEILRMATIGGATALGLEKEIGSLEKGKKADVIVIETDSVNMNPIYDYESAVVYSANPSNVEATIVNGELLMHHRRLFSMDLPSLKEEIRDYQGLIRSHADRIARGMGEPPRQKKKA